MPNVTPAIAGPRRRSRVLQDGGASFDLSLPMLHAVDAWADSQPGPRLTRQEAIGRLLDRGLGR